MVIANLTACGGAPSARGVVIDDSFAGADALIAAEKSADGDDSDWLVTSGTLFRDAGQGWTGVPDDGRAAKATGSAVFRMVSKRRDFTDLDMTLRLEVVDLVTTGRTPAQSFDGAHIWLRYQTDRQLYAVSVDRRDATMIVKKKCAGGDVNGGTYFDLSAVVSDSPIPFGRWQQISVAVRDRPDGSVVISADRDGHRMEAVDRGVGCPPLLAGGVGIRGDNAELRFDDIRVVEAGT